MNLECSFRPRSIAVAQRMSVPSLSESAQARLRVPRAELLDGRYTVPALQRTDDLELGA